VSPKNEARIEWNIGRLRAGAIVNVRGTALRSKLIRAALANSWSNHDALLIAHGGKWWIGDAEPPRARLTPLEAYSTDWAKGLRFRVLWPEGATEADGQAAADWWLQHVLGKPYDLAGMFGTLATVRLLAKVVTAKTGIPWPEQWHWAWYCTESVVGAWSSGAGRDVWQNPHPTPRTTENRLASGALRDITAEAICVRPE